jgi:lauroyl/myristoyl acyltransferase
VSVASEKNTMPGDHAASPMESMLGLSSQQKVAIGKPLVYSRFADTMLGFMFFCARLAPWFFAVSKPMWMMLSHLFCRDLLRDGIMHNARWLLGPQADDAARRRLANRVLENFYHFIHDIGRTSQMSAQQLRQQVGHVKGYENYESAYALGRGVIVATAHLGSYEIGIAAAAGLGPKVHVVFKHDPLEAFNLLRRRLHAKLGVIDALVDEGWPVWMKLRDALAKNELVLIQSDRVVPGQRGTAVRFCDGNMMMPLGLIKFAAQTGAPILPVFTPRQPDGTIQIVIEPAIHVEPQDLRQQGDEPPKALKQLAAILEKQVRRYPDQWLMLHRAWVEDIQA